MSTKNIFITILFCFVSICISIYLLNQIELNKNEWESAKDLNLTNYQGSGGMTYNLTKIIKNNQKLCDSLGKLKKTLFFKIFKINLDPECSVFRQEMICKDTACQICECSNIEVPRVWKQPQGINEDLVTTIDDPFNKWVEKFNVDTKHWLAKEDIDPKDGAYINLLKNPEGYTGYRGAHIWNAIFKENCFSESYSNLCVEDKIFSNIFMGWLVNTNFQIGCNFRNRETNNTYINVSYVTNKYLYHKDKIDNLLFLYGLMIKSINKAVPLLLEYDYRSGNKTEDQMTYKYTKEIFRYELLNIDLIEESFKDIYSYFEKFTNSQKISELIIRFRNISSIIDCVTCSKCRMHAKLEVFGIATMLKIVFTPSTEELKKSMSRNELVAFINLFAKLSKSVSNVQLINDKIKQAHYDLNIKKIKCIISVSIIGVILTFIVLHFLNNDNSDDLNNDSKDKKKKKE